MPPKSEKVESFRPPEGATEDEQRTFLFGHKMLMYAHLPNRPAVALVGANGDL